MALGSALKAVATRFTFEMDGGKLAAINRTTGTAVNNMSNAAKQAAMLRNQMGGFLGGFKAFIGLAIGSRFIKSVTTDYAAQADTIAKLSAATQLQVRTYQGLVFAGQIAGLQTEEINKGLIQLPKRAFDAGNGMKDMADSFDKLFGEKGFSKRGLKQFKDADQLLLAVADRFKALPPSIEKSALAQKIFGRTGAKMLVLLNEGSAGIQKLIAENNKRGDAIGRKAAKQAEEFQDTYLRYQKVLRKLRNQIARAILPVLTKVINRFNQWTLSGKNATIMLWGLVAAGSVAGVIIAGMITRFVIAQWGQFRIIIGQVLKLFKALNVQMLLAAAKVALIVAGLVFLALLIEDLIFFAQGERSLVGRIFGQDEDLLEGLYAIRDTFREINDALTPAFAELWASVVALGAAFGIKLTTVGELIKTIAKYLFKGVVFALIAIAHLVAKIIWLFSALLFAVVKVATAIIEFLGGAIREIGYLFSNFAEVVSDFLQGIEDTASAVALNIAAFFVGAANMAKGAWKGFMDFLDRVKTKAADLATRGKNLLLRRTETLSFEGTPSPGPGPVTAPPGGRPGAVVSTTNVGGVVVNAAPGMSPKQVASEVTKQIQRKINGVNRDIKPSVAPVPVVIPGVI